MATHVRSTRCGANAIKAQQATIQLSLETFQNGKGMRAQSAPITTHKKTTQLEELRIPNHHHQNSIQKSLFIINSPFPVNQSFIDGAGGLLISHIITARDLLTENAILTLGGVRRAPLIGNSRCLKITEKVSFNIASEASYIYILSGQNGKKFPYWRVFENLQLPVKQRYQTGNS